MISSDKGQLTMDIAHNADERLERWAADTVMRCDAVGMPIKLTKLLVMASLIELFVALSPRNKKGEFMETVGDIYDSVERKLKKANQK